MHATGISSDEKKRALDEVLRSAAFRRSEQLRQFLSFVVTEELAGRGAVITEWEIAVRALGRPESYTPDTDSAVRTRAHALRQKLTEYYSDEARDADVVVELPRGGYVPRFRRSHEIEPSAPDAVHMDGLGLGTLVEPAGSEAPVVFGRSRGGLAIAFAAGVVVTMAVFGAVMWSGKIRRNPSAGLSPGIREIWGSVLDARDRVRIVVASPPQLWVRDYGDAPLPSVDPVWLSRAPQDPELFDWYRDLMPITGKSRLFLHPNAAGMLWGDAAGALVATRFLESNGTATELVPERSIKSEYVLRGANVLVFGHPEYSPLVRQQTPAKGFTISYLPDVRRHGVVGRDAAGQALRLYPEDPPRGNYGLITIRREMTDDGRLLQYASFSGVISNGAQAAMEYLTTPRHAEEIVEKLRRSGTMRWPKAMQIVVRVHTTNFYPIRTEYVTHSVIEP